jgi:hypothetical protein
MSSIRARIFILLKVDVIGTGCIIIARRVLEKLKAPFMEEVDESGIVTMGEDFAFCRKAKAADFEVFTTPKMRCEHWSEVGLHQHSKYEDSEGYYQRRTNLKGRKVIIGLGTGRCGSVSLSYLLSLQPGVNSLHEAFIFPWEFNEDAFMVTFPKLFYKGNNGEVVSDTSSWYLNYVDYILGLGIDASFICLRRDKEKTVDSWMMKTPFTSHMTHTSCEYWDEKWLKQHPYRHSFPKYDLPKREAIERYYDEYYVKAREYEAKYPKRFKIFPLFYLNHGELVAEILNFVEIPKEDQVIKSGIHLNRGA